MSTYFKLNATIILAQDMLAQLENIAQVNTIKDQNKDKPYYNGPMIHLFKW